VIGEQSGSRARVKQGAGGKDLIAELGYMEGIYETRVAAAERLLAFYVLFHAAVRPVSRLWGLRFDMDRSESRLRVASTPAPVPFVESMDAEGPGHDGAAPSADPGDSPRASNDGAGSSKDAPGGGASDETAWDRAGASEPDGTESSDSCTLGI